MTFHAADIRDPRIEDLMRGCDVLANFAFVVEEIRDKTKTHDINLRGSQNVFESAARAGIRRIVYISSLAAYGIHPDNPVPLTEECPLRGNEQDEFYYSWAKREVELYLDRFCRENPAIAVTRLRPGAVIGPEANALIGGLRRLPFLPVFPGKHHPFPFVHEKDMARAIHLAVSRDVPGAFNIVADPPLKLDELARLLGKRSVPVPWGLACAFCDVMFHLGSGLVPGSRQSLKIFEHSVVAGNAKAREVLGWKPEHAPQEAFRDYMKAHGAARANGVHKKPADLAARRMAEAHTSLADRRSNDAPPPPPLTADYPAILRELRTNPRFAFHPPAAADERERRLAEFKHVRKILSWVYTQVPNLASYTKPLSVQDYYKKIESNIEDAWLEYNGHRIHVEVHPHSKKAPTLIFNPGLGAFARVYAFALGAVAAEGFNVISFDRKGHGLSDGARGVCTFPESMEINSLVVDYAIRRFGDRIGVFGSSYGGIYTLSALTHDPRIRSGLCHNVAVPDLYYDPRWQPYLGLAKQLARLCPWLKMDLRWFVPNLKETGLFPIMDVLYRMGLRRMLFFRFSLGVHFSFFGTYQPRVPYEKLTTPVMILVGSHDPLLPVDYHRKVLEHIGSPRKELKVLDGAAHFLFHDNIPETVPIVVDWFHRTLEER